MTSEEREAFKKHLVFLTDGARLQRWLTNLRKTQYDVSDPLASSDVLTLGVLLVRRNSVGWHDEIEVEEVESTLWQAVARKRIGPESVHSAALLADEACGSEVANATTFFPWLREAVPALLTALLRSPSPKGWALAEESAPLLARHVSHPVQLAANGEVGDPKPSGASGSSSYAADADGHTVMPLLESLVRAAHSASQENVEKLSARSTGSSSNAVTQNSALDTGIAGDGAAARVLSAALASIPARTLASQQPWRMLIESPLAAQVTDACFSSFNAVPLMSTVGRALARAATVDDNRRVELCNVVEKKLRGNIQSRAVGLEMLRAILCSPEQPLSPPDVQLAVRWALHAASSAKLSLAVPSAELAGVHADSMSPSAHRLWVSTAAVLIAAAPYLPHVDLTALRDGWLAPRLAAQALTWRHAVHEQGAHHQSEAGGTPPVCTLRSHVSIPFDERLRIDAAAALIHADLVLTAYVEPAEFKARIMNGGIELGLTTSRNGSSPGGEKYDEPSSDAGSERWGYLMAAAVMATLANLLQSCLDVECKYNSDVARHNDFHAQAWRGVSLGLPASDIRRALLHRLSHLLALQRGIEQLDRISGCASASSSFAVAVSSLPRVQVSTWISAVESILSEDAPQSASFAPGRRYNVPDVAPQVQAGIFARAAAAVSVAVGLKKHERTQGCIDATDSAYILRDMVNRGILQKSLILAERLAPNVTVTSSTTGVSASSHQDGLSNRYQMLADRLGAPREHGSHRERGGTALPLQSTRKYGRWAETSANTRAAIVAGCFELCTVAAQAPASAATEASVMYALAAPVLHLETWNPRDNDGLVNNRLSSDCTGNVVGTSCLDQEASSRRYAVLQWVIARGSECTALRAAIPALSLGASILLSSSPSAAAACTPMLVTALASAALWGQTDANSMADPFEQSDLLFGNPFHFAQDLLQEYMMGSMDTTFLSAKHHQGEHALIDENVSSLKFARNEGLASECSQRAELLRTAHHLTLKCNGTDAAISMIADVMHVVLSKADPVSFEAAATTTMVALHLLAAHLRLPVSSARESSLNAFERIEEDANMTCESLYPKSITRIGRLMVQAMDAAVILLSNGRISKQTAHGVDMLCGANAVLLSLISAATWIGSSSASVPSGSERFEEVARAAFQSSGRLGVAVESSEGLDNDVDVRRECAHMGLHRMALRAAVVMQNSSYLTQDTLLQATFPSISLAMPSGKKRSFAKYRNVRWVDMAAQEPSSDEDNDDGDDDAMFCVRPSSAVGGIAGWDLDDDKPTVAITDGHESPDREVLVRSLKKRHQRTPPSPSQTVKTVRHRERGEDEDDGARPLRLGGSGRGFPAHVSARLEEKFKTTTHPTAEEVKLIGQPLGLTGEQVRVWFMNRRARGKKSRM